MKDIPEEWYDDATPRTPEQAKQAYPDKFHSWLKTFKATRLPNSTPAPDPEAEPEPKP